jgi:hypothetical protein
MKKCPFCAEFIDDEVIICPFCEREVNGKKKQHPSIETTSTESKASKIPENVRILYDFSENQTPSGHVKIKTSGVDAAGQFTSLSQMEWKTFFLWIGIHVFCGLFVAIPLAIDMGQAGFLILLMSFGLFLMQFLKWLLLRKRIDHAEWFVIIEFLTAIVMGLVFYIDKIT